MYEAAINAAHRMLLSWWLYIQSIKSGSVYLVGPNNKLYTMRGTYIKIVHKNVIKARHWPLFCHMIPVHVSFT